MNSSGYLVISLDFEMMWGCHDWATPQGYGQSNIAQVREVVTRLLALFRRYDVHATFATVGLLFCKDKGDALKHYPPRLPSYFNKNLSPFRQGYIENIDDGDAGLYFASDIIDSLKQYGNVEIGSHTFSHYYCWEQGQSLDEFRADLEEMYVMAVSNDVVLKTIVFPKNEVSRDYVEECAKWGLKYYRGNAPRFFSEPKTKLAHLKDRLCRLLDAYINIGGRTSTPLEEIRRDERLVNIRASRFIRPYSQRLSFLEGLRLRRIKKEMLYAAKHGEMYHLWWHPHNFGANTDENMRFITRVLACYWECHSRYGMRSCTIEEMGDILLKE